MRAVPTTGRAGEVPRDPCPIRAGASDGGPHRGNRAGSRTRALRPGAARAAHRRRGDLRLRHAVDFTGVPLLHRRPARRGPVLLAPRHCPDRRSRPSPSCSGCTSGYTRLATPRRSPNSSRSSPSPSWPCSSTASCGAAASGSPPSARSPRRPSAPYCRSPRERIGGLEIAARYEAAQEDAFIGGDLYAVQDTPHGVRLRRGRRTRQGHGRGGRRGRRHRRVPGGGRAGGDPGGGRAAPGAGAGAGGHRRDGLDEFEGFTTAVLAEIPHGEEARTDRQPRPSANRCSCARTARSVRSTPGSPHCRSGWASWAPGPTVRSETEFPRGATLLLYTDGLSEARDERGRLLRSRGAARRADLSRRPSALLAALADEVRRHIGRRHDGRHGAARRTAAVKVRAVKA